MSHNIKPLVVITALVSLFSVTTFAQKGKAKPVL